MANLVILAVLAALGSFSTLQAFIHFDDLLNSPIARACIHLSHRSGGTQNGVLDHEI